MRLGIGADEAVHDDLQVEAVVEVPLELSEVAGKVLGAHPAACVEEVAFQVSEDRVDPLEGWMPGAAPSALHLHRLVARDDFSDGIEAGHAVREHR